MERLVRCGGVLAVLLCVTECRNLHKNKIISAGGLGHSTVFPIGLGLRFAVSGKDAAKRNVNRELLTAKHRKPRCDDFYGALVGNIP